MVYPQHDEFSKITQTFRAKVRLNSLNHQCSARAAQNI